MEEIQQQIAQKHEQDGEDDKEQSMEMDPSSDRNKRDEESRNSENFPFTQIHLKSR